MFSKNDGVTFTISTDLRYLTGVTDIPNYGFAYCFKGASFVMLPNVKTIRNYVLRYQAGSKTLTTVELSESITSIGEYFCNGYTGLQAVIIHATTPPSLGFASFKDGTTKQLNNTWRAYVPDEAVDAYKAHSSWSAWASRILPLSEYQP